MSSDPIGNKLAMVLLSNNTIKRRIQELSVDILKQTIAAAQGCGVGSPVIRLRLRLLAISIVRLRTDSDLQLY